MCSSTVSSNFAGWAAAGAAFDHALRRLDVRGVEVAHLRRRDFTQLLLADAADLLALLGPAALVDAGGLAQHVGGRRRLEYEGDLEDGDLRRDDLPGLRGGLLVVLLAELHDVDRVLTEGGTHRRRGRCLARLQLDAHNGSDFLGH
jgi:hypothetical protein